MPDDLKDLLGLYSSGALSSMASYHGLAKHGPKAKPQTIAELCKVLVERDRIQRTWKDLSPAERATVEAILQRGGKALTGTLRAMLTQKGLVNKAATAGPDSIFMKPPNARAENSRRFEDVVARLTLRGLIFAADDLTTRYPGSNNAELIKRDLEQPVTRVYIPEPIRRHLPQPAPLTTAAAPVKVAAQQESSARTFQRDLYLYWSFVRGQPLALTSKDEPHKSQLKEVNATLLTRAELGKGEGEIDHPRLRFVRLLLEALSLFESRADSQVSVSEDTQFFALAPAERVRKSFETWRDKPFFSELLLLPRGARPARFEPSMLDGTDEVLNARRTVLETVEDLAGGGDWVAFDRLLEQIRERDYEFLLRRPSAPVNSYAMNYYRVQHPYTAATNRLGLDFPNILTDEDGWDKVEANFIRGVVLGPLAWMGLADLGWTDEAKRREVPAAFRLTQLGRWLLGRGPEPVIPAAGGRVIVQPNLHVIALDPVNDATLVTLDRFAERLSAERAVEYQLTRESVYAGQQQGWDTARIQEFLRQQTGAELPGNVARSLDEWQAQHERIVIHAHVALVHGTAGALDAVMHDPGSAPLVVSRPGAEVLRLVNAAAIPAMMQVLGAHGILPLRSDGSPATPNAVEAAETGEVRLLARRPSLFLHGHLAVLADPAGEGRYQISAATVARAVRAGLSAPDVMERLQAVHRGPVPEGLTRRVRAWAKHYGEAAVDDVVLLQVRDAATLDELMADPEIAPLLRPFKPAPKKALARVQPADVEKLRALLAERGVGLKDQLD